MFMVDIAVPRDIEPEVETLEDVYLYTVDDLQEVIQGNLRARQSAADVAQVIIDQEADGWSRPAADLWRWWIPFAPFAIVSRKIRR